MHYSRHHKAYVDALNTAVKGTPWEGKSLDELFSQASKLPAGIRNNGGGHWNHTFYWSVLRSSANNPDPSPAFQKVLEENFGTYQNFKYQFRQAGLSDFGSGWAWLIVTKDGRLHT